MQNERGNTNFYLGVWHSDCALSVKDAAKEYAALYEGRTLPRFHPGVYHFCSQLTTQFPEIDMLAEAEVEESPWACAWDISDGHVIVALKPETYPRVFPVVLQLADQNGLICFDPQNQLVHLPSAVRRGAETERREVSERMKK